MPSISLPTAILGAGALGIGGSIASGLIGSNAAQSAANTEAQAANNATNTQLGIFNQTQSNLAPYNQIGQSALSQLAGLFGLGPGGSGPNAATSANAMSSLQNYPGYQFQYQQGLNALNASSAAQGTYLSGNQLAAAQQYGQGYAQNAWNGYLSQLSGLANTGESAAAQTGTIGASTGNSVAQTQLAAGNAAASGTVGSANALTSGLSSALGTGLNSSLLALALNNGGLGSSLSPLSGLTSADYG